MKSAIPCQLTHLPYYYFFVEVIDKKKGSIPVKLMFLFLYNMSLSKKIQKVVERIHFARLECTVHMFRLCQASIGCG